MRKVVIFLVILSLFSCRTIKTTETSKSCTSVSVDSLSKKAKHEGLRESTDMLKVQNLLSGEKEEEVQDIQIERFNSEGTLLERIKVNKRKDRKSKNLITDNLFVAERTDMEVFQKEDTHVDKESNNFTHSEVKKRKSPLRVAVVVACIFLALLMTLVYIFYRLRRRKQKT